MSKKTRACPICEREVLPLTTNRAFPFCSPRCKTIDLGNWLGETYRIPGPSLPPPGEDDDSWQS